MSGSPAPWADMRPSLNVVGHAVALGPQRRDLVPLYQRWLNDYAVLAPLGELLRPLTREAEELQYRDTDAAVDQVWFTVYERTTLRPLGISGLRDIDHPHSTAEFVVFLGERELWGRGYGTETTRLVLDYGFTALGLHSVLLRVYDFNVRGIRAYTRAGFREVGRWRQAHRLAGRALDVVFMDCLASEFESPVLRRLLGAGQEAEHLSMGEQPPADHRDGRRTLDGGQRSVDQT